MKMHSALCVHCAALCVHSIASCALQNEKNLANSGQILSHRGRRCEKMETCAKALRKRVHWNLRSLLAAAAEKYKKTEPINQSGFRSQTSGVPKAMRLKHATFRPLPRAMTHAYLDSICTWAQENVTSRICLIPNLAHVTSVGPSLSLRILTKPSPSVCPSVCPCLA